MSELLAKLIEAGTPAALVAEVAMELAKAEALRGLVEQRRVKDRERKRMRNSTESTESAESSEKGSPLKVSPQTPLPQTPSKTAPLSPPIPDWLPEPEWSEFRRMRKAMRNVPFTSDAEKRVIAKLEKLRGEGHCPAKLLAKAIERGHRSVFEDEATRADRGTARQATREERIDALKKNIAFYSRVGRDDDVAECRKQLAKLECGTGVANLVGQIGKAA